MSAPQEAPTPYSDRTVGFYLREPYIFFTGLMKIRNEIPAGFYRATYQNKRGIFFQAGEKKDGVFITHDRLSAYTWGIAHEPSVEEKRLGEEVMGPGTVLIASLILPEPKPGSIGIGVKITGDWKQTFEIVPEENLAAPLEPQPLKSPAAHSPSAASSEKL
jgi:hypothetical protein